MARRTAKGLLQQFHGGLLGLGILGVVPQHLVGTHGVIHVVGAFFSSFDLPRRNLGDIKKGLGQNIEGEVGAGEQPLRVVLVLLVQTATGLYTSSAQTGFAAKIAGPVAAAGNAVAQRTMHENLQIEILGAGVGHHLDFIQIQLAGNNHAVHAQLADGFKAAWMAEVGKGGKMDFSLETDLPCQLDHGQILHDDRKGFDGLAQSVDQPACGFHIIGLDQCVHGNIGLGAAVATEACQLRQLADREVGGLHAGRKMLEADINGIRARSHRR